MYRVTLVTPPFATVSSPSIALTQLKAMADDLRIPTFQFVFCTSPGFRYRAVQRDIPPLPRGPLAALALQPRSSGSLERKSLAFGSSTVNAVVED
jgi:hypothetical protein